MSAQRRSSSRRLGVVGWLVVGICAALCSGGCATAGSLSASRESATRARAASVERAIAGAKQIYQNETGGQRAYRDLRFIASDRVLMSELERGEDAIAEAHARLQMISFPVLHITRISVVHSGRVLANAIWNSNGFFVVAPVAREIYSHGRALGSLMVSTQDIVGYVKLVHRDTGAQVVIRGASGQVRTSLLAAARTSLPAAGTVTIAGSNYSVGTFGLVGWGGEPLTVWVLLAA